MFAVIKTGGKQYRVAKDDVIVVEKLAAETGATVELNDILMVGEAGKAPTVGTPIIDKAVVTAEVVEHGRGDKIVVFKKNRRKGYRRTAGHRQEQTVLRITEVSTGAKKAPAKAKAKAPAKTETPAEAPAEAPVEAPTEAPTEAKE